MPPFVSQTATKMLQSMLLPRVTSVRNSPLHRHLFKQFTAAAAASTTTIPGNGTTSIATFSNGTKPWARAAPPVLQLSAAFHATRPLLLDEQTRKRIEQCIQSSPVVVFMKGTKQEPMCGFSQRVKAVLNFHGVPFKDFNVLEDEQLRQGIKEFSEWPTIPQVYVNGKFVGGSDIIVQMHESQDFAELLELLDGEGIPSRYSKKLPAKEED